MRRVPRPRGTKKEAMKDAQIIRQFIADNTEEVLALAEELGLSLITATHDNSIN